ncbi:nuclear pore complex protein Nup107 [Planococcus citri]|uniref:nuclear pore complex protein Nup107 n=1 Tax=Planococcus citri TaxID=170843 RepID=UPI0031F96DE6
MAVPPEIWMNGKFKSIISSPENSFIANSTRYSCKTSLNIEIEETFSVPYHSKTMDNIISETRTSEYGRCSSKATSGYDSQTSVESLCRQFLEIVEVYNSREQVFDMMSTFFNTCSDFAQCSANLRSQDKIWLENEKNTWRLMYALYENRLHYVNEDLCVNLDNDLDIMKNLFQNNDSMRECQLVVDWLEECAAVRTDRNGQPKMSHFTDKTVVWENTLQQLQIRNVAYSSQRALVTAMDPDAPQRQKKQIHDLDEEDETRLLEQIFLEIRCGRLNKAVEICCLCGHKWRAAILQGWMLFNDPNFKSSDGALISAFGNPHRDIWRVCAWRLIQNSQCSNIWKAILGIFCGNLSVLVPHCKDWEDLLWAYMKVYIDVKVEQEIRAANTKPRAEYPDQYWDFKFSVNEIFEELAGFNDNDIRVEACTPERIVQRLIITDRIPDLISAMSDWCCQENPNPHLIRMAAHVVICLRLVGVHSDTRKSDVILRSYVKILMKIGDAKLVAYYTAMLNEEDQIVYYSEFLQSITDESERIKCLEAAEMCNLQIEAITKYVVQVIRNKANEESKSLDLATGITKEDQEKISALDLIMHYSQQRHEAIWETNALVRYFLSQRNIQAANYAFCKIPEDSINMILEQLEIDKETLHTNPESVPSKIYASIREYFSYKVYLNAEMRFADWFHTFHKLEPSRPQKPSDDAQFTQKVAYEHHLTQYNNDYQRWTSSVDEQTKIVKSHLYNVLLFPDGGWLVENRYFEDSSRIAQMNALRKLCIPKIVILLHTVLHSIQLYDECLKLAEIITSEENEIYKAYSKQDLGEILKKICDSSVCLLNNGKDPWSLPVSS